MASTFLSPGGDYSAVAEFCGVKASAGPGFADANVGFVRCVDSAANAVRTKCGPIDYETGLTLRVKRATAAAVAPFRVAAITAVVAADGSALDVATFEADGHVVERTDGSDVPACTITYASGWPAAAVPVDLTSAGFELARHLWRLTLGNTRAGEQPGQWLWPRQAMSLAEPYFLAPLGFA